MRVIYKGNIVLKVSSDNKHICIRPVVGPFDNPHLLQSLARNEELLAQVHLFHSQTEDPLTNLACYFEQKGWLVRPPGQAHPLRRLAPGPIPSTNRAASGNYCTRQYTNLESGTVSVMA